MGAKVSEEMRRAVEMVKAGATRYAAAKRTGLTLTAISNSRLYLAWKAEQEAKAKGEVK